MFNLDLYGLDLRIDWKGSLAHQIMLMYMDENLLNKHLLRMRRTYLCGRMIFSWAHLV